MKQFNKLLFWASGARVSLLDKITELEKRKFQLIGTSLLISGFVSFVSIFYATLLISQNILSSTLIGVMWGIMITNVNRLSISSIIYNNKNKSINRLWRFSASLILACFFALIIAFPLQLKIFENEINNHIIHYKSIAIKIKEYEYVKEIDKENIKLKDYEDQLMIELSGKKEVSKSGVIGYGKSAYLIRERIEKQKKIIDQLEIEKSKLRDILFPNQFDFMEKVNALNEITKRDNFMTYFYFVLFSLFFLVEITPLVIAYTSKSGLYEELVEKIESTSFDFERSLVIEKNVNKDSATNKFTDFCISSIVDINHDIDNLKREAKEQLRNGLLLALIGILAYLGYGTFLFVVYFENHKFQNHHIFLFSVLSGIFFFIQFIGGWYLKQYRTTTNYANSLTNSKERYKKLILAKIATSELPSNEINKLIETKFLVEIIGEVKISEQDSMNHYDSNGFVKDIFDSINNIKDLIHNIGKSKT